MAFTLEIPDSIANGLPIPPRELRERHLLELGIALSPREIISIGRCDREFLTAAPAGAPALHFLATAIANTSQFEATRRCENPVTSK